MKDKKRNLFSELMTGVTSMKQARENNIILGAHDIASDKNQHKAIDISKVRLEGIKRTNDD